MSNTHRLHAHTNISIKLCEMQFISKHHHSTYAQIEQQHTTTEQ